ncbi:MAG: hypothetical protein IJ079_00805 [Lachnospiraceae bacterium]|nr:hypothetical protein [Lachnospiraceae bacterium]
MKAVVMELRDQQAAVLTVDGSFEIVADQGYTLGQTIQVEESDYITASCHNDIEHENDKPDFKKRSNRTAVRTGWRIPRAVAAILICVLLAGGITTYAVPYSTVSIDVNPSFALSLNMYDRILAVNAYSEDDQEAAESLQEQLKGKTLAEGVEMTLDFFDGQSYLEDGTSEVVTSVSSHFGRNERLQNVMKQSVESWNLTQSNDQKDSQVILDMVELDEDLINEAEDLGVSPGKLGKVKQLQESADNPSEINTDEWLNRPIRDIEQKLQTESREPDPMGTPPGIMHPNGEDTPSDLNPPNDENAPSDLILPDNIDNPYDSGSTDYKNIPEGTMNPDGVGIPPEERNPDDVGPVPEQDNPDKTDAPPGINIPDGIGGPPQLNDPGGS